MVDFYHIHLMYEGTEVPNGQSNFARGYTLRKFWFHDVDPDLSCVFPVDRNVAAPDMGLCGRWCSHCAMSSMKAGHFLSH